jgi:hypothetical protein
VHASHCYSFLIFCIGKSLEPDGKKIGEGGGGEKESTNAFDVARFTSFYEHYNRIPPTQEELDRFSTVEENLFYLVSFILENDQSLLDGDFIAQVMNQFDEQPQDMMEYAEDYILKAKMAEMIEIDPPLPVESPPPIPPPLQITPAFIEIENGFEDIDTTRDAKRGREQVITRQQSRSNVLEIGN